LPSLIQFAEKAKKRRQMQITAVQIMQMD